MKTLKERFEEKYIVIPNGCWIWTACLDGKGYGVLRLQGKNKSAHRLSYELYVGKIPEGLELDHKCRQTDCVNWLHLEPVTHAINMSRGKNGSKTHCVHGHEFSKENTRVYIQKKYLNNGVPRDYPQRFCIACNKERGLLAKTNGSKESDETL